MSPIRETLAQAGYRYVRPGLFKGEHVLSDDEGTHELWFRNQGHASYGIVLDDGSELEFARTLEVQW